MPNLISDFLINYLGKLAKIMISCVYRLHRTVLHKAIHKWRNTKTSNREQQKVVLKQSLYHIFHKERRRKRRRGYSLCGHWYAWLPAVVLSTEWTWLAVRGLSKGLCLAYETGHSLIFPQGVYFLCFTPPPTSGPFSWRPDIPVCTRTFLGTGSLEEVSASVKWLDKSHTLVHCFKE